MSATEIRNTFYPYPKSLYYKYEGLYKATFPEEYAKVFGVIELEKTDSMSEDLYIDEVLISDRHKILWNGNIGIYNLYYSCVTDLISELRNVENPIVIIDDSMLGPEKDSNYFNFFLQSLTDAGIEWKFLTIGKPFYIKNFSRLANQLIGPERLNDTYEFYSKYIKNKNIEPFRKVYLSRKHMSERDYFWVGDGLSTKKDYRLYDEHILESFLESIGVEVIVPEEKFDNFEDQINYFNETKILISLSSSGIANSIFMQKQSTIIELMTTYPEARHPYDQNNKKEDVHFFEGMEKIHHIYHALAYLKNHTYIGIPNYTRQATDMVNILKGNSAIMNLIGDK